MQLLSAFGGGLWILILLFLVPAIACGVQYKKSDVNKFVTWFCGLAAAGITIWMWSAR